MGRASRTKQQRRTRAALGQHPAAADGPRGVKTAVGGAGEWAAAVSARQCARLLGECARPHPSVLTVMVNAVDQYLVDVAALTAGLQGVDDGGDRPENGLSPVRWDDVPGFVLAGFGTGLAPQRWREEFLRLGADMARGEPPDVVERHRVLIERMHTLFPHGKAYPPHTEAYVISPEMHNVVRAAALTVTREDLFTLDPDIDPPTPAGLLLLPGPCRSGAGGYPPISAVGWRPESGHVLTRGARRGGLWVEGLSLRRDLDSLPMWAAIVAASRTAQAKPPLALPFSHEWLLPGRVLTEDEHATLAALDQLNDQVYDRTEARAAARGDSAEFDPAHAEDTTFCPAAYVFAFWRLCRQPVTATDRLDGRPTGRDRSTPPVRDGAGPGPVDRVRVVMLRPSTHPGADAAGNGEEPGAGAQRYHHRFPVRMHKVRQYYPSLGVHKVIWRGPYIKGPDGAPLLIGPIAQAVTG